MRQPARPGPTSTLQPAFGLAQARIVLTVPAARAAQELRPGSPSPATATITIFPRRDRRRDLRRRSAPRSRRRRRAAARPCHRPCASSRSRSMPGTYLGSFTTYDGASKPPSTATNVAVTIVPATTNTVDATRSPPANPATSNLSVPARRS